METENTLYVPITDQQKELNNTPHVNAHSWLMQVILKDNDFTGIEHWHVKLSRHVCSERAQHRSTNRSIIWLQHPGSNMHLLAGAAADRTDRVMSGAKGLDQSIMMHK